MTNMSRINLLSHCPHFTRLCYVKKFTRCCLYKFVAHSYHQVCLQLPPFSSLLVNSRCKNFLEITTCVYDFRRVYVRNPCRKHGKQKFTMPKERSIKLSDYNKLVVSEQHIQRIQWPTISPSSHPSA